MNGEPDAVRGDGVYRPVLARGDGHLLYLMARSTALDGDWIFDNDLARFGDPWREPTIPATGRKGVVHPIGPALVWTPLIWIASAAAVGANALGAEIPLHGYALWHQRFVFLFSAIFACLSVWLGLRVARRFVGGAYAPTYGAIAVLLGTSITYYATFMPSYGHAMDALACAAFLAYWALTIGRVDVRRWVVLGILLGIATLIRVQEVGLGVVVLIEVAVAAVRGQRFALRGVLGGMLVLGVCAVVFIPQLLEWRLVYGAMGLPQGSRFTRFEAPMVAELLFSSRNGWFSTTPVAYLSAIGLLCLPRQARLVAAGLLSAAAIQVYLNSTIHDWWAGASFGQRRMCNMTLPLVVGLGALIWRLGRLASHVHRSRTWVWHLLLFVALGPIVALNVSAAWAFRGGRSAPSEARPSCCDHVPTLLQGPATWWYERLGNPFQFPANVVFALRHDVEVARWDIVGSYPLVPPTHTLADDQFWSQRGEWPIGDPRMSDWIVDGFSAPLLHRERRYRFTTQPSATVLVPNLMPYGQRLTLWLAPGGSLSVRLRWNGEVVAERELSDWTPVSFDLPDIELHTNELTVEATPDTVPVRPGWPSVAQPIGVAVGDLELQFLMRR